jgi:hypothetical protein
MPRPRVMRLGRRRCRLRTVSVREGGAGGRRVAPPRASELMAIPAAGLVETV